MRFNMVKRILKYSCGIVLLLVVVFFSFGIFVPVIRYESKVSVNKPIESSFRIFNSVFYLYDWVPGLTKVEPVSGTPGLAGYKWKMLTVQNGEEYPMTGELLAFKENELFEFRIESDVMTNDVKIRFINKNGTTEIVSSNCVKGKNIFWKSVFVFTQSYFIKQDQTMYDKLKEIIEKKS